MIERPTNDRVRNKNRHRWIGKVLLITGLALLTLEIGYLAFIEYERNTIGNVTVSESITRHTVIPQTPSHTPQPQTNKATTPVTLPTPLPVTSPTSVPAPSEDETVSVTRKKERIYTESSYKKDWDETSGEVTTRDEILLSRFRDIEGTSPGQTYSPPTRIRIPAINLDAQIQGLRILNLGNERAYETPKNVVGHIPESAPAGAAGNVWLFGHLESLILGEGSVFRDLPKIYELLKDEQIIYTVLDSDEGIYLYQIHSFETIPRDDLSLWESDQAIVTMVTCWPRLKYDERILVTARLVGVSGKITE
jgi:sortase (surface protein transpeptidase)